MDEARLKSERSEALEVVEYDSSDHDSVNRYLFHDRLTPECSILSQIGWTMSNIHHHSIDDPFSDFATSSMPKSEANIRGVDGLLKIADTRPSISAANMSSGASGLVETVSTSNPSASSSSSDQDLVEKSIGFGETAQPNLQIPSSKSKKKEQKRIRQPRIAFVTKSEVDHLEDGYRWRKYGQKAVKNSPYPRSYYRCTNMKCTVKKRVERSRQDPTTVVTTYEGQHCHQTVAFPRGAGLSIRETVLGGKIGPPNSQFYYPGMQHLPRQSPHAGIASNTQPTSVPDQPREASRMITCNEPQLPAAPDCSAQLPSNEGLLEDIVSPRRRNLHP